MTTSNTDEIKYLYYCQAEEGEEDLKFLHECKPREEDHIMFGLSNRSSTVLENYRDLIEDILSDLGIDPQENLEEAQEKQRYSWCIKRGSANIFVELFTENQESYFMVDCPILRLPPADRLEAFYRKLLELNDKLVEAALVCRGVEIHLVGIRPLRGLDGEEASGMLDRISAWADSLDNSLSEEFGAPLWEGPSNDSSAT